MTKRFNQIGNFMDSVRALTAQANTLQINPETIEHICALDPEFSQDVDKLIAIFTSTPTITPTTPEPEETEEEQHPDVAVETSPEVWKNHPDLEGIEVSTMGNVRVNGTHVEARLIGGYMRFYGGPGKYYALAAAVLTTFAGHTSNSMVPIYKDGNKENCRLENLHWGMRECTLSTSAVERACKLIAENPKLNESEMLNLLVREKTIRSVTALRSILSGNWRTISDRYFLVRQGSIIPVEETTSTPTTAQVDGVDDSGNLRGILSLTKDPEFVKKLYKERLDAHKASSDDLVALILSYMMLGLEDVGTIQKAIRKDFGRKLMVSNTQLKAIIG